MAPATYTVTEAGTSGWLLQNISCNATSGVSTTASGISVAMTPGANISCTFVNVKTPCSGPGYVSQGGLCWMPISTPGLWTQANNFCSGVINAFSGWRQPTEAELLALYSAGSMNGQGWMLDWTWSSTFNGSNHQTVNLTTGGSGGSNASGQPDTSTLYISCVHP